MTETDIQKIADSRGIARSYVNVTNETVIISEKSRRMALEIMGYPLDDPQALKERLDEENFKPFKEMLEPVTVLRDQDAKCIYIRIPADLNEEEATVSCVIELEDGSRRSETLPLGEIEIADYQEADGREYDVRRYFLLEDLPYGYHHFSCSVNDGYSILNSIRMSLIRAPQQVYQPEFARQGRKLWGLSVQLYTLRTKSNWGIGDFADLKDLLKRMALCGGQFVGLNPLHAGYPANPDPDAVSPYSPSSRRWLNIVYINVPVVPEYAMCPEACEIVASAEFQHKLKSLREREYVDYRGVLELKLKVLRAIFDHQKIDDRRSLRGRRFCEFVEAGGRSLLNMATYDAIQKDLYSKGIEAKGWQAFPRELQNAYSPFVDVWRTEHADDVRFYSYLQFLAAEQLEDAYSEARKQGLAVGTYRDLAVGVSSGSCDVWSDSQNIYRSIGEVGAPPDPLGPRGQCWGLSPMDPYSLKNAAYEPMIELYRSNMISCGALRIDHAAGLYRFWWVPKGGKACDGTYVATPMHDLLGIIALESVRNKCLIIGEDLGTIPQELRVALKEAGVLSYKMFFDERAPDGGFIAPQLYAPVAMAALTTHDMPTLKGWWNDLDLIGGIRMGVYTEEESKALREDRARARQRILDSIHGLHSVGDEIPTDATKTVFTPELAKGLQVHMCRSACMMYSSQLEDWIGVEKPVNIPGTFREYPNWRRKLTRDLDEIFDDPYVKELTEAMSAARAGNN